MSQKIQFQSTPEQAKDIIYLKARIKKELRLEGDDFQFRWNRRSIDARKRDIKVNCSFEVFNNGEDIPSPDSFHPEKVHNKKQIAIVGSGPAGLFAALRALEVGLKPIVFERGKDVRSRRRDLALLNKED